MTSSWIALGLELVADNTFVKKRMIFVQKGSQTNVSRKNKHGSMVDLKRV